MTLMSINSRDICELELLGQAAAIGQEAMYWVFSEKLVQITQNMNAGITTTLIQFKQQLNNDLNRASIV